MPINYQQVQQQVKELGRNAPKYYQDLRKLWEKASHAFEKNADRTGWLRVRVEMAVAANSRLRCASPVGDNLAEHFPDPQLQEPLVILAADGSQILPSRHDRVEFGLINVGSIRIQPGENIAPETVIRSELLDARQLHPTEGDLTEGGIAMTRDMIERTRLAELSKEETLPVVALTDGPLEPFVEPKETPRFQKLFREYLDALHKLSEQKVSTAGYVDKPGSDLVVRMLELASLPENELDRAGQKRPFRGITDISLFKGFLKPGERSTIFEIKSIMADKFKEELALHFFYLNVGSEDHPYLARVEVPAWVVKDSFSLDMLHSALVSQCKILGNKPYPYALHRSHEVAVVTFDEKRQLQNMIEVELLRNGVQLGDESHKQIAKQASNTK